MRLPRLWPLPALLAACAAACGRTGMLPVDASGSGGADGGVLDATGGSLAAGGASGTAGAAGAAGAAGTAEACAGDADCADADACTRDRCEDARCRHRPRDDDGDGHGSDACGGDDCNDLNPNVLPGHAEICTDAADNDCDGVADCFDPRCYSAADCGCDPSPGGEACSGGLDEDCDTTVDCNDADCMGTPACGACAATEEGACSNGVDDDCDGEIDCDDGLDCIWEPACECAGQTEVCWNGVDDDCDLSIDCGDPKCAWQLPCKCLPPAAPEACQNEQDDDCDGQVDCGDADCLLSAACQHCVEEKCSNGQDDDCDGQLDCGDSSCWFDAACPIGVEQCTNLLDDDHDSLADCRDPDCANAPACVEAHAYCVSPKLIPGSGSYPGDTTGHLGVEKGTCGGEAGESVWYFVLSEPSRVHLDTLGSGFDTALHVRAGSCTSGKEVGCDDDSGDFAWASRLDFSILYPGTYYVFVDGFTVDLQRGPDEGPYVLNVEIVPNPPEACSGAQDDDGDHLVDCADPDCSTAPGCAGCAAGGAPSAEFGKLRCTNGLDDDCDGASDCADDDCSASEYYVTECCDGDDDNGNDIVDDLSCRCASHADCDDGRLCYDHTVWACEYPCDQFVGDICPFVAPGSYCNVSTQQCEF